MSARESAVRLLDELAYPPDDVRAVFGEWLLVLAEQADARVDWHGMHSWRWLMQYAMEDLTFAPNDPPTFLDHFRCRVLEHWTRNAIDGEFVTPPAKGFVRRPDGSLVDCRPLIDAARGDSEAPPAGHDRRNDA